MRWTLFAFAVALASLTALFAPPAFADDSVTLKTIEGKVFAGIHMCQVDALYDLKHGGADRFCLLYRDPSKPGKRWYVIYGMGRDGQPESIVEGDDATVTWKRVWKRGAVPI